MAAPENVGVLAGRLIAAPDVTVASTADNRAALEDGAFGHRVHDRHWTGPFWGMVP